LPVANSILILALTKKQWCIRLFIPIIGDLTLFNVLIFIAGLLILWVIVSIPVYIAGKVVTSGESTLGDAMIATLFGPIVYVLVLFVAGFLFGTLVGSGAYIWALIVAFIAWVGVFKASFSTGWLGGIAIAILAILVFAVISTIFGVMLGLTIPAPFFPRF
jgi:hypothetical protein